MADVSGYQDIGNVEGLKGVIRSMQLRPISRYTGENAQYERSVYEDNDVWTTMWW